MELTKPRAEWLIGSRLPKQMLPKGCRLVCGSKGMEIQNPKSQIQKVGVGDYVGLYVDLGSR